MQRHRELKVIDLPAVCLLGLCAASSALAANIDLAGRPSARTPHAGAGFCAYTAQAARTACGFDTQDNYFIALGACANVADAGERAACQQAAGAERAAAPAQCAAQFRMRDGLCDRLGQAPYDPPTDPSQFVDPANIGGSVAPNAWFPLVPHSLWHYAGSGETVTVEVTGETTLIRGIPVAVVRDTVLLNGQPKEDTIDWYAQDVSGNVWYFGEATHTFDENGLIAGVEGTWKAGENNARQGYAFLGAPRAGALYRQEFSLGTAEDIAEVLNVNASATVPAASCSGNCVLTQEFTPVDPAVLENKYYAPGVGFILETDPQTGEHLLELVSYRIGAH